MTQADQAKCDARDIIMQVSQEAMGEYARMYPNWLSHYNEIAEDRLQYINLYVFAHTTSEQRAAVC